MQGYLFGTVDRAIAENATIRLELYGHTFFGRVEDRRLAGATDFPVAVLLDVPDDLIVMPPVIPGMDGPSCPFCGGMTKRAGSCYVCGTCGNNTGCG